MSEQDPTQLPFGVPLPAAPPRRWLDPQLHPDLNQPRTIEVDIPVRDGVLLAADVHLPAAARLPAPAVVIGTPYDKSSPFDNGLAYRDAGYVAVVYDCRGRCKSEGEWHPFAEHDGPDGHDVVEWAARQDWCDGAVGVSGISYLGWVVWATMSQHPPHLKAAVSTAAAGRWQQEIPYTYGCLQLYFAHWHTIVRRRIADSHKPMQALERLPFAAIGEELEIEGPGWRELLEHEALDEMWRSRRWDGEYDFDVPTLHVAGWHDREDIQGAFHHYEQMLATSPARGDQYLLAGPWSHVNTRFPDDVYDGVAYPGGAVDMDAIHVRFFDHYLRGVRNGVDEEPRVRVYDTGAGRWRVRERWQAQTGERELFLAAAAPSSRPRGPRAATATATTRWPRTGSPSTCRSSSGSRPSTSPGSLPRRASSPGPGSRCPRTSSSTAGASSSSGLPATERTPSGTSSSPTSTRPGGRCRSPGAAYAPPTPRTRPARRRSCRARCAATRSS